MRYGSIYLVVKDFNKSLDFYEKLLDMKVSARNGERFAVFNNDGLNICLKRHLKSFRRCSQLMSFVEILVERRFSAY